MMGKGRCFELAAKHLQKDPTWTLVHGYAQLVEGLPLLMAHAWLEKGDTVYDPTRKEEEAFMPARRYRARYRASARCRYRAKDLTKLLLTHKHWGPWDAQLRHDLLPGTKNPSPNGSRSHS